MAFEKGQVANPVGDSRAQRLFLQQLMRASVQEDHKRLRAAAEKLLDSAAAGEAWAIKEVADRFDGRPKQQIEAMDADGRPLAIALVAYDPSQVSAPSLPAPDPQGAGLRH